MIVVYIVIQHVFHHQPGLHYCLEKKKGAAFTLRYVTIQTLPCLFHNIQMLYVYILKYKFSCFPYKQIVGIFRNDSFTAATYCC